MTLASLRIVLPFTLLCMLFIPLVQGQEIASCESGEFLTLKETGLECSVLPDSGGSSLATPDKNCPDDQLLSYGGTGWVCISSPAPPTLSDFVDIAKTDAGICVENQFLQLAIIEDELKLQCAELTAQESEIPDDGTAGQVLTISAELDPIWADVESAGASTNHKLLSLLPVERTYVAFPSFSAGDVSLVDGNTKISVGDATTEFNEGDWVVIKQSGESNEKAIERGSVARVVSKNRRIRNYSVSFGWDQRQEEWLFNRKNIPRPDEDSNGVYVNGSGCKCGHLNKDAVSATEFGDEERGIISLGYSTPTRYYPSLFYLRTNPGYIPSDVSRINVTFSTSPTNSVSFEMDKYTNDPYYPREHPFRERAYSLFSTQYTNQPVATEFIEANHEQRIFMQVSYDFSGVELEGDYTSQIQNQDNIALIKTRLGEGVQKDFIPDGGVEGQVLTKTADSFAWAGDFTNYDLLALLLVGKKFITLPSFSADDVSLVDGNTRISIDDTTGFTEGDWVVIKRTGESNEEAAKRGSVTRVVSSMQTSYDCNCVEIAGDHKSQIQSQDNAARVARAEDTVFRNYSAKFVRNLFSDYEDEDFGYSNPDDDFYRSQLNKDATSATEYGAAETRVWYLGIHGERYQRYTSYSADVSYPSSLPLPNVFLFWFDHRDMSPAISHLNVTLSTSPSNSVSFKMERYTTLLNEVSRFKEINTTVAQSFIAANHNERIFVQISYPTNTP